MTPREQGFLLLTSQLGNPERRVLTTSQLRNLAKRAADTPRTMEDRNLTEADLRAMGYGDEMARRIIALLEESELLEMYLRKARKAGCAPITRVTETYPLAVRRRLGLDSPGCLWARGDLSLLNRPKIALVGSRELRADNREFAAEVGLQAAKQGFTLVSGNAKGADRTAQEACLAAGGTVISVVADELSSKYHTNRILYLSEDGFDLPFTAHRALSRNRIIHSLGDVVLVAQCGLETGGTWDGTVKNLRFRWSRVYGYDDGSEAMNRLNHMGMDLLHIDTLEDISVLLNLPFNLFDQ